MPAFQTSRTFDVIFLLILGGVLVVAAINRVAVGDAVFFFTHQPTARATQAAAAAGLSPAGAHLLYRTNPQFDDAAGIVSDCGPHQLGCLTGHDQAFIFAAPDKPNQTIVTAAHEMLHLAYQRLSQSKKDELAPFIDQAIGTHASDIDPELSSETDTADRRDEAHSLLGTEYNNLPTTLEQYYATYFTDRSKVVAAAASKN